MAKKGKNPSRRERKLQQQNAATKSHKALPAATDETASDSQTEQKTDDKKSDQHGEENQNDSSRSKRRRRSNADSSPIGNGWVGVDLDGTLAEWCGWQDGKIGPPIPAMHNRVKRWVKMGIEVRIFTARASVESHIAPVEAWLAEHGLPGLAVTNVKDYRMLQLWDDRAIQVVHNTGELFKNSHWTNERQLKLQAREQAQGTDATDVTPDEDTSS